MHAWLFPNALFRLLFASAAGEDKALAADREFRASITNVLNACFIGHVRGYARDIGLYVQPWKTTLAEVPIKIHIWHGAEDNWSPKAMAEYLKSAVPNCRYFEILHDASHYSCLRQAAPKICNLLGEA